MKKFATVLLSSTLILTACGDEEKVEKGATKINTSSDTATKSTDDNMDKAIKTKNSDDTKKEKTVVVKEKVEKKEKQADTSDDQNKSKNKDPRIPSYVTADGHVDILDKVFIKDYFGRSHINDFAGIEVGMDISEVEKMYGKSEGPGKARQYPTTGKFGDIALDYEYGKVTEILINPSQKVTKEQMIAAYQNPSEIEDVTPPLIDYIYDGTKGNGYQVIISAEPDGYIQIMDHMEERRNQGKTTENKKSKTEPGQYLRANVLDDAFIKDFLANGTEQPFGTHVGMTYGDLVDKFGEPTGTDRDNGVKIVKYGEMAFYFSIIPGEDFDKVEVTDDEEVTKIAIFPSNLSTDAFFKMWKKPSENDEDMQGDGLKMAQYNHNKSNGINVIVDYNDEKIVKITKWDRD